MQKAVVYINRPDGDNKIIEQVVTKLLPLYETAKKNNLSIVNHFFEKKDSVDAFSFMLAELKKDSSIKNVVMDTNEIILNEKLFLELLSLKRNVYIVGEKTTNVITPDNSAQD